MLSHGDTDTGSPVFVTWCSVCSQLSSWALAAWRQMTAAMIVWCACDMIRADGNMMCDAIIANCHQIRYKYEQITTVPSCLTSQCQPVILEFHKSRLRLKCDLLPLRWSRWAASTLPVVKPVPGFEMGTTKFWRFPEWSCWAEHCQVVKKECAGWWSGGKFTIYQ